MTAAAGGRPYRVGDIVSLDLGRLNPADVPLEVAHVDHDGNTCVRWTSGAELTVQQHHLTHHRGET